MSCAKSFVVMEASAFCTMHRITVDGEYITQADVSSVEYAIINEASKAVETSLTSLTVSSVIFDTLQTDRRWKVDNTGYNFRNDLAHTVLTDPLKKYRLEHKVTLVGGTEFWLEPVVINLSEIYSN